MKAASTFQSNNLAAPDDHILRAMEVCIVFDIRGTFGECAFAPKAHD